MHEPTPRLLKRSFELAWPISLQNVLVIMLSMVDIVMVGHLGDTAVASVGLGNRIQFVVLVVITGLSWGVGVLCAQYYGGKQFDKIKRSIVMAAILGLLTLIPLSLANYVFMESIIGMISTDPKVIETTTQYLMFTMPSLIFVAIIMVMESALRSIGQVRLPMVFGALIIGVNIVLNYWLINGGIGIDAMGVNGAALATLLSRMLHLVIFFYFLYKTKHYLLPTLSDDIQLTQKKHWIKLIQLVWPMMFSFGVWSIGTFGYQVIYAQMGTKPLAVISLLTPIEGLFMSLFFGFASACSIIVGHSLGANNFQQAWRVGKSFVIYSPLVTLFLGLLILALKEWVFYPYRNMDPQTIELAYEVFTLITLGACIKVCNMTLAMGVLRAGGDNKYCLYIDLIGLWVVSLPLTYLAAHYFGLPLILVVLVAYSEEITKMILFTWRMKRKHWLKNIT